MKKTLLIALLFSWVLIVQAVPVQACAKTASLVSTGDGDMIIETGENIVWKIAIWLNNWQDQDWTDVVVRDNLNAELEIDSIQQPSIGSAYYYTKGKSEKVVLIWNVGTLPAKTKAHLVFYVSTDINPGGHQEYTSPGEYTLNSGPVVKWRVDGVKGKYSEEIPSIYITVVEQS